MRRLVPIVLLLVLVAVRADAVAPPLIYSAPFASSTKVLAHLDTATGNTAPLVNLTNSSTAFANPTAMAIDSGGNLWVADQTNNAIYKFAAGVTGANAPAVTISGVNTQLAGPIGCAFDSSGNLWTINGNPTLQAMKWTAAHLVSGGNIAPDTTFTSSSPAFVAPNNLAIDSANRIYVSDQSTILVFPSSASGSTAPTFNISGATTTLNGAKQLALDSSDRLFVANYNGSNVLVFNQGRTGNVAPDASISGANTTLSFPRGVAIDKATNRTWVYSNTAKILEFNSNHIGNFAPDQSLTGASTLLVTDAGYLAFDAPTSTATPTQTPAPTNTGATQTATPNPTQTATATFTFTPTPTFTPGVTQTPAPTATTHSPIWSLRNGIRVWGLQYNAATPVAVSGQYIPLESGQNGRLSKVATPAPT